jgi:hypothetical protein
VRSRCPTRCSSDTLLYGLLALTLAITGALIASRQPANPIGWIFCALSVCRGFLDCWEAFTYHGLPTGTAGRWIVSWSYSVDLSLYAVICLLLPTGRLMSRRWRRAVWVLVAGCVLAIPGEAMHPRNAQLYRGRHPDAVDSIVVEVIFTVGMLLVGAGMVAALLALVIRYRHAVGVERLQLRLFVLGAPSSRSWRRRCHSISTFYSPRWWLLSGCSRCQSPRRWRSNAMACTRSTSSSTARWSMAR